MDVLFIIFVLILYVNHIKNAHTQTRNDGTFWTGFVFFVDIDM